MSGISKAGIETAADGGSYIPSSRRPDGSTRKEIRVRPGYRPPEDVETYKNRSAESWKNKANGGVPGADVANVVNTSKDDGATKSKNARRREAARKKAEIEDSSEPSLVSSLQNTTISENENQKGKSHSATNFATSEQNPTRDDEAEQQKKIRNHLKKLKAVRELKDKKAAGEKLSPDQLMKVSKEREILRDLKKLGYDDAESQADLSAAKDGQQQGLD